MLIGFLKLSLPQPHFIRYVAVEHDAQPRTQNNTGVDISECFMFRLVQFFHTHTLLAAVTS